MKRRVLRLEGWAKCRRIIDLLGDWVFRAENNVTGAVVFEILLSEGRRYASACLK